MEANVKRKDEDVRKKNAKLKDNQATFEEK